jgi:phosphoribosylformylglycinamidine synthase
VLKGKLSKADIAKIKHYCINPVEAREAALELPKTLEETLTEPGAVAKMTGFLKLYARSKWQPNCSKNWAWP